MAPGSGIFIHAPCNTTEEKNIILFSPKPDVLKCSRVFILVLQCLQEVFVFVPDTVKLYSKEVAFFFPKKLSIKERAHSDILNNVYSI